MIAIDYSQIKTKEQLEEFLRSKFNFNLEQLKGKQTTDGRIIDRFEKTYIYFTDGSKVSQTAYPKIMLNEYNPVTETICDIYVSMLLDRGYSLKAGEFKSLYYKTEEYKQRFKKGMLDAYGVESPLKSKEIKKQFSKTMNNKYGVPYFTCRGKHYKKVDEAMIEKYGAKVPIQNSEIKEKN